MNNYNIKIEYKQVLSNEIFVDSAYQRQIDLKRVAKIVAEFNPALVSPVKVSYRDGMYYVFDGQHTLEALRRIHKSGENFMVECKVYYDLTAQDEALFFAQQNGISRDVQANAKAKALHFSGDADVITMKNLVESVGLKLDFTSSKGAYKIVAVSTLSKIYHSVSHEDFCAILSIIRDAWKGAPESFNKDILEGMCYMYKRYKKDIDMKKVAKQIGKVPPQTIMRDGQIARLGGAKRFARLMVQAYNKNLRGKKLSDDF